MNIKDYLKDLRKLAKKYPDATLVYASDDEGNSFSEVNHGPSPVLWDEENMEIYYPEDAHGGLKLKQAIILN